MLQFIAEKNDKYSIPEQAQMAIEGGCQWVVLRLPDFKDEEIRELATELVPLCKETGTILTIENHVEMAKELGIHGVFLRAAELSASEVRELCGPEAIIGVAIATPGQALQIKGADIDYVAFSARVTAEELAEHIAKMRAQNFELPIVAETKNIEGAIEQALHAGANGVAVASAIGNADNPVEATKKALETIEKCN